MQGWRGFVSGLHISLHEKCSPKTHVICMAATPLLLPPIRLSSSYIALQTILVIGITCN